MKLSILAAAAGLLVVPVLAYAQTGTTMKKDTAMSAMKMADTSATAKKSTKASRAARHKATAEEAKESPKTEGKEKAEAKESPKTEGKEKAEANESAATKRAERRAARAASNGTDCPRGCPTSKGAAGLTGVQFLALQQELRDQGCGNTSVTGVYDGATRHAVSVCAKKLNVANKPGAVLVAFNIGFSESDIGTTPPKA